MKMNTKLIHMLVAIGCGWLAVCCLAQTSQTSAPKNKSLISDHGSIMGPTEHSENGIMDSVPKTYTKPSDRELKLKLTKIQYDVTQREGTEPPFQNAYWDNKDEGIYVDVVSGEPLFSSREMFKSGTGWPSFFQPLVSSNIVEKVDRKLWSIRTEVRSKNANSHLGHVFNDGPRPTGLRYCINSAALRFIPVNRLEAEGYSEFIDLFEKRPIR